MFHFISTIKRVICRCVCVVPVVIAHKSSIVILIASLYSSSIPSLVGTNTADTPTAEVMIIVQNTINNSTTNMSPHILWGLRSNLTRNVASDSWDEVGMRRKNGADVPFAITSDEEREEANHDSISHTPGADPRVSKSAGRCCYCCALGKDSENNGVVSTRLKSGQRNLGNDS